MSSRTVRAALIAIRDNVVLARQFTEGLTRESFGADQRSIDAVTRCLEIVSEASRRLSDEILARHPSGPWHQIRAAGNVYRHKYDSVAPAILWVTVEGGLDNLERAVGAEIARIEGMSAKLPGHLHRGEPDT